jgi:hypothetical protein
MNIILIFRTTIPCDLDNVMTMRRTLSIENTRICYSKNAIADNVKPLRWYAMLPIFVRYRKENDQNICCLSQCCSQHTEV